MLVRHGQTQANIDGRLDTRPPGPPLTEQGREQARELAGRLGGEPVDAVYASVAVRARQTAEPLAASLGLPVRTLTGVHEIAAGELEDASDRPALLRYHGTCRAWGGGELDAAVPGGENGHQFLARYRTAVDSLRATHETTDDALAVVVSHGAAIRVAAGLLAANVDAATTANVYLTNTQVVELRTVHETEWRCTYWNGVLP